MSTQSEQIGAASRCDTQRERIGRILARYPHVSNESAAEIVKFLRKGPHFEVGILMGDARIKPQLDAFMSDQKEHFRLKLWEVSAAFLGIVGVPMVSWLVWELVR